MSLAVLRDEEGLFGRVIALQVVAVVLPFILKNVFVVVEYFIVGGNELESWRCFGLGEERSTWTAFWD
jgi:hypothetical protein